MTDALSVPTEPEVLEWIPDAVVVSDGDGRISFVNRQTEVMTGYAREELTGHKVELLLPADARAGHVAHRRHFHAEPAAGPMGKPDVEFKLRRKDGTVVPVDVALGPLGTHTVAVIRDVTERRSMELALEHRALHDPLTQLANRNLFLDRLRQAIHAARRESGQVALVMLDLDGFKSVNDAYGHLVGDAVLKQLGARFNAGLRATDTAARVGGDEFAWILPRVSGRTAVQRMVRRRLAAVEEPVIVRGVGLRIGVSAGIAMYPEDGRDVDTLMGHADAAMYSGKREDRAVVFHLSPDRRR